MQLWDVSRSLRLGTVPRVCGCGTRPRAASGSMRFVLDGPHLPDAPTRNLVGWLADSDWNIKSTSDDDFDVVLSETLSPETPALVRYLYCPCVRLYCCDIGVHVCMALYSLQVVQGCCSFAILLHSPFACCVPGYVVSPLPLNLSNCSNY